MSKFNIFTIDLRVILLIIVATGVYALLLKFLQKNSPHNVQTKGGGGQRLFEQCSKTALFLSGGFPQGIHTPNCFGRCWDFFTYRPPIKNHKKLYNVYFVFKAGWDCQTSPWAAGTKSQLVLKYFGG